MDNKQYLEELRLLGEEVQQLEEKNCPTDTSKWSYYKSQAKKKFDVYPSAYANGWASKQYKAAGGGWKKCASEATDAEEKMSVQSLDEKLPNDFVTIPNDSRVSGMMKHLQNHVDIIGKNVKTGKGIYKKDLMKMANIIKALQMYESKSVNEAASFKITNTISKKEWAKTHKDYKSVIDGVPYVMKLTDKGTALVPVKIVESVNEVDTNKANLIRNNMPGYVGAKFAKKASDEDLIAMADLKDEHAKIYNRYLKDINDKISKLQKKYNIKESVNEGKKRFNTNYGVGKSKYVVNYHDGVKKHKDGSDFFDVKIFKNQKDLEAFKKDLVSKGFVAESVNEAASRTAMEIGGLTGMNKDAIQKFVDDNNLDIEKVYQYVKVGKLPERMALVSAIAGKPGNSVQVKLIKKFK